jgi:hypothetical protein
LATLILSMGTSLPGNWPAHAGAGGRGSARSRRAREGGPRQEDEGSPSL